jgi:hypothetical protein
MDYQPLNNTNLGQSDLFNKMMNQLAAGGFAGKQAKVMGTEASYQADYEREQAKAGRAKRLDELNQKIAGIEDALDPGKFQRIRKADGGYDFLDGAGKPITVEDYSAAKKIDKGEALKDSRNYQDIVFLRNYNATMDLLDGYYNQDEDKVKKITKQLAKGGVDVAQIMPKDVIAALYEQFPQYFMTESQKRDLEKAQMQRQGEGFYDNLSKWVQ